ncbi:MAG: metallophosphoesterase [Nanoarchaeota archaeon]
MKIDYIGKCLLLEEKGERVLVIGDLHLGYEGAMRASGVMIPVKLYNKCIADFDLIIFKVGGFVENIVILGDIKHEFGFILNDEWNLIVKFIEYVRAKCSKLVIIEGNHDVILFPVLNKLGIVAVDFFIWNNVAFAHGDKKFEELYSDEVSYWVLGHGHPAVTLYEGVKKEKYKCFLVGDYKEKNHGKRDVIIVPSFFPLIEGTDARDFNLGFTWEFDLDKFEVKIVSSDLKVFDFGKLGKIKSY